MSDQVQPTLFDEMFERQEAVSESLARTPRSQRDRSKTIEGLSASQRYEVMYKTMLNEHGVRVRKWRSSSSGVAWQLKWHDGTTSRLIESPKPKGPMSAAIFLHEIGHHAIGFDTYKPRCLEEFHAWMYSLVELESWGIQITQAVRDRVHDSLYYAVGKAKRRGLQKLPPELIVYARPRHKESEQNSKSDFSNQPQTDSLLS
jgi:hypothetical protein